MESKKYFTEVEVKRSSFPFPEYVFVAPAQEDMPTKFFLGKSLEEIRDEYGDETAQAIYHLACNGVDLTKKLDISCRKREVVRLRKEVIPNNIKIYLVSTNVNEAEEDLLVCDINFMDGIERDINNYVNDCVRTILHF